MRRLRRVAKLSRKFIHLGWSERRTFLRASVLLVIARISVALLPFATVFRIVDGTRARRRPDFTEKKVSSMVSAVKAVGNGLFPKNPCLPQALVVHWYLRRLDRQTDLRFSVRKGPTGRFDAHAWVESDGTIVIGGEILPQGFVPLPPVRSGNERR